ncbi:Centromere protein I [Orchesella cincta]|uniref:Centromere protein I n=1 Tax=Orchesella cincta TaxID=48709 RepID=A0A1D2NCE1_ORCCI|nr:Centromere protein I [Orchesella cincta]
MDDDEIPSKKTIQRIEKMDVRESQFPLFNVPIPEEDDFEQPEGDESSKTFLRAMNELWENLPEATSIVHKRTRRRKLSPSTFDAIEKHADKEGYCQRGLLLIWNIASCPSLSINCKQRLRLIFSMLPINKVSSDVVETIINWLVTAKSNGIKTTVIQGVYQLLILYSEYRLVEGTELFSERTITQILQAPTENLVIPWKMLLFSYIAVPKTLSKLHHYILSKMIELPNVKKTQRDDVQTALMLCEFLRPDLIGKVDDIDAARVKKFRTLNFPKDVRNKFFKCRTRILDKDLPHPMADKIFPEFLPESMHMDDFQKNAVEIMLKFLNTAEGVLKIALSPPLFEVFSKWLEVVLYHKFGITSYSKFNSAEDLPRYGFIIDCCVKISRARQQGIPVVNEWLVSLLTVWDYQLFQGAVLDLLPYMAPHNVQQVTTQLTQTFITGFTDRSNLRRRLWEALSKLMGTWFGMFKVELDHPPPDDPALIEGVIWLIDTMRNVVNCLAIAPDFNEDSLLFCNIMRTYETMVSMEEKVWNDNLRMKMLQLPPGLIAGVSLNQDLESVVLLGKVMQRARSQEVAGQTGTLRNAYFLMNGLTDGSLDRGIMVATHLQQNFHDVISPGFQKFSAVALKTAEIPDYDNLYNTFRTPQYRPIDYPDINIA